MSPNTTIALVPGAFHDSSVMDILRGQLQQAGYNTCCMTLKSVGKSGISMNDDVIALKTELLDPVVEEQGKDVVLYLHSYAGFPGSAAIRGFSKSERSAQGKKGGIIGLIYQSAFIPKEGSTLFEMIGGSYAAWQSPDYKTGLISVVNPKLTFYADVLDPLANEVSNLIRPQSMISFNTASGPVYYTDEGYDDRRVYIRTKLDQALPPLAQDLFMANSGVNWHEKELNSSHSPFLSEPTALATLIQRITKEFERISEGLRL